VNKLVEIASAWIAAANPTEEQKQKAEARIAICNTCEYSRYAALTDIHYCGECGCPLKKKIFSPLPPEEACPKKYWKV